MLIVKSIDGLSIRLTEERWDHIRNRHPEMEGLRASILETVSDPELIQQGDYGELLAIRFYPRTPLTRKYLVVVYKKISADDGFILTSYLAARPSSRRITIWKS